MQAHAKPAGSRVFYLTMMALITAVILYGFSHTLQSDVLDPPRRQPLILYVHAVVYTCWLVLLIAQSALIRARNPRLHRRLGYFGAGFAAAMVVIGIATTVVMGRIQVERMGLEAGMFIYRPIEDIAFFAAAIGLAIHWRKRPDFHRRAIVLAACALTPPAISRIPGIHSLGMVYLGTDLLVMIAILHDLLTLRRVHEVYRYGLGIAVLGQSALLLVLANQPAPFLAFVRYVTQ